MLAVINDKPLMKGIIIKYYKKAILLSGLFVIIFEIVWAFLEYDPDYKSEWLTSEFSIIWTLALVTINAIFISILSITMFVNIDPNVRNNLFLSFICWFLIPMIWLGYLLGEAILLILEKKSINGDILFLLVNSIPYIFGLIWSFVKFRQKINNI